jgi:flagellar hook capping protein FlgD
VIGLAAGARPDFDALDLRKPPVPPGPWVRAALAHPEWGIRAGDYRRDLRSPASEGETWELEVRSAHRGEVITLALTELAPGAEAIRLLDREQGTSISWVAGSGLRAPMEQTIVSFGDRPYRLAVAAGSERYVGQAAIREAPAVPSQTQLDRVAPNPFFDATRIRFGLPRTSAVKLEIYGLQGERIASLLSGSRLEAGYHSAVWDGRKLNGGRAASGVYVARLEVEGAALTTRLVLVR